MDPQQLHDLITLAFKSELATSRNLTPARDRAYAPYSKFRCVPRVTHAV
jgi:hypothetical protein